MRDRTKKRLGGVFRYGPLLLLIFALLASPACIQRNVVADGRPAAAVLSPKLNPFVYFQDGIVMFIGVDTRAAQYVKEGRIVPIGLGLANQSESGLTFSRESFVLEDSNGKQYPLVSVEEFNRDYKRSRSDARLADTLTESMNTRFPISNRSLSSLYNYVDITLFPTRTADRGAAVSAQSTFGLPRRGRTQFYLYFPMPETGLRNQEFTLRVTAQESPETYIVRFQTR